MPGRVIKVYCKCGYLLCKYYKDVRGRLIKCYLDEIRKDYIGITETALSLGEPVFCPNCGSKIGYITLIHGRKSLKLNQEEIKKKRT